MVEHDRTSRWRTLWWGATKACPRCGRRGLFDHYFTLVHDCPRCGLHFEREPGYFAGALAVNIALVGGPFAIVLVVTLALTIPDVPVALLLALSLPIVIFGPIVAYPWSKTLWMAVDRAFLQRLDPNEQLDEIAGRRVR